MTSQDYKKVEQVKTLLLSSSSASFQQFRSKCFFQALFSLIRTVCRDNDNLLRLEPLHSTVFFARSRVFSLLFFQSEASNGFPVKPMFS